MTTRSGLDQRLRLGPDVWVRLTRLTVGGLFALAVVVSLMKFISLV